MTMNHHESCSKQVKKTIYFPIIFMSTLFFFIACDGQDGQDNELNDLMVDLGSSDMMTTNGDGDQDINNMLTDMFESDLALNDMSTNDMEIVDMTEPDMAEPDMELGPPACSNGQDDDQDDLIDYPRDPGCINSEDVDETDPELFACEDQEDNDEDGLIDLDDPGCAQATDPTEESICGPHQAIDISNLTRIVTDSEGAPSYFEACRSNNAPEQTFVFTLRQPVEYLYFSTEGSGFDTLLSVRRDCEDLSTEVACNDDVGNMGMTHSTVQLDQPALGDYYLIVDGYGESAGRVVLTVEAGLAEGSSCPEAEGPLTCPRGQACNDAGVCAPSACADLEDNDLDDRTDYPSDPGCDSPEDQDEEDPMPLPECGDQNDNDRDGLIDFPNDLECEAASDPREGDDPACDDGQDNDRDGLTDFPNDPGCEAANDPNEYNPPACDDGQDNDEDGFVDFPNDPGCVNEDDTSERTPINRPQCADGIDNDNDGLIDYPEDEISCQSAADQTEDNPCDRRDFREITGLTSARGTHASETNDFSASCGGVDLPESLLVWRVSEDRPLQSLSLTTRNSEAFVALYAKDRCEETETLFCRTNTSTQSVTIGPRAAGEDIFLFVDARFFSGIWRVQFEAYLAEGARCDNEGIPGERWICGDGLACIEDLSGYSRCVRPQCSDRQDNDGDGLIDYPNDPGCPSSEGNNELDPDPLPACSNNIDEDRDGLFDFGEDPDCDSAADQFEGPSCQDGIDNDGDGRIDFSDDRGGDSQCACANDSTENVTEPACSDFCDNDGDGLVDDEDPGCDGANDNDEFNELQCRDDLDNDEDGLIDYPFDPGCDSPADNDETTPTPIPECGDLTDNDGDGLTDYGSDDSCTSASDPNESGSCDLPPLRLDNSGQAQGNTAELDGSQIGTCGFGLAPEAVYYLSLAVPTNLRISTLGSNFNTVLYVRSTCRALTSCAPEDTECEPVASEIDCNQDGSTDTTSQLSLSSVSGDIYIFVDGLGLQSGDYVLNVTGQYPFDGACDPTAPSFITCPSEQSCLEVDPNAPELEYSCQTP